MQTGVFNPLSSVKDRIGYSMITSAERAGKINARYSHHRTNGGNTGIALVSLPQHRLPTHLDHAIHESRTTQLATTPGRNWCLRAQEGKGRHSQAEEIAKPSPRCSFLNNLKPSKPGNSPQTTAIEIWDDTVVSRYS
jgi:cysteine synthase A